MEFIFDEDKCILIGRYLIDKRNKTILAIDKEEGGNYVLKELEYPKFKDITSMQKDGGRRIEMTDDDGQKLVLDIDEKNAVINLDDPFVTKIDNVYFDGLEMIKNFSASNLNWIGVDNFLSCANLESVNLPRLKKVGDGFLFDSWVEKVHLPNLEVVGVGFMSCAQNFKRVSLPSLTEAGTELLSYSSVEKIELPNLRVVGNHFLAYTQNLKRASLPNLTEAGSDLLKHSRVEEIDIPNLRIAGNHFLAYTQNLKRVSLPNLTEAGSDLLKHSRVEEIDIPNLREAGVNFLDGVEAIETLNVPPHITTNYSHLKDLISPNNDDEAEDALEK